MLNRVNMLADQLGKGILSSGFPWLPLQLRQPRTHGLLEPTCISDSFLERGLASLEGADGHFPG